MTVELWDALDERGNRLGFDLVRGEGQAHFHAVVEVVPVDENGRALLTLRAPSKHFGNRWEITAGSALKGETSEEAAVRELYEETGIAVSVQNLIPMKLCFQTHGEKYPNNALYYCYLASFRSADQTIRLQPGETVDFKFVDKAEFLNFYRGGMIDAQKLRVKEYLDRLLSYLR